MITQPLLTATRPRRATILGAVLSLLVGVAAPAQAGGDVHRRRLAALAASEPTVGEVRQAALRHAGLDGAPDRGWARRARWSALVPRLSLRTTRGQAWDEDWSNPQDRQISALDNDVAYEARAVFELDRLVFDPAEIRAATAGQQLHRARLQIGAQVVALWYRRRARQIQAIWHAGDGEAPEAAAVRELEIEEITSQIDAMTDGFLSKALERSRFSR